MGPQDAIRIAREADLPFLAAIELAAAKQFRGTGLEGDFLTESMPIEVLTAGAGEHRLWVATHRDACVGFALASLLEDGQPWLDEIDVHPDHGRRGIGRALVERVLEWARRRAASCVSLTTFRDVPWNAPFYAKLGFRELAPAEYSREICEILEDESRRGLPLDRRVVMRCDLAASKS